MVSPIWFFRIMNKTFNWGKSSVPTVINGLEVISSFSYKVKLFAMNFESNIILDDHIHFLSDYFTHLIKHKFWDFTILAEEVCSCQIPWLYMGIAPDKVYCSKNHSPIISNLGKVGLTWKVSVICCFQECWWALVPLSISASSVSQQGWSLQQKHPPELETVWIPFF